jgi:exopolyphosphatase / guanosine-5'-triphosphate,3'-diphosphate pyrophosphatase
VTGSGAPIGALDIGSNTVRLMVALPRNGSLDPLLDLSAFARLGKGVDTTGLLDSERETRAVKAIREFTQAARDAGAERIIAVATSAIRDAKNGEAFIERVRRETGIEVQTISGEREAELTFFGATLGMSLDEPVIVVDLGGGSGEIIAADDTGMRWGKSLPIGSGRLTERFVTHDPPRHEELEAVEDNVRQLLKDLPPFEARHAVYTGGTARRVPSLLGLGGAEVRLSPEGLARAVDVVAARSSDDLVRVYDVEPERAQVFAAGTAVLHAIAGFYRVADITITQNGIRHGMIVDRLRREGRW